MKVSGEYTFAGSQDLVWGTLMDPEVLAAVLPGCEKLELVGDNEYEGALNIKVGPVQGKFMGKVKLDDLQDTTAPAPSSAIASASGGRNGGASPDSSVKR